MQGTPIVLLRLKSWIISWNVYVLHHLQLIFNHGVSVLLQMRPY